MGFAVLPVESHAAIGKISTLRALANKQIPAAGLPFIRFLVADLAIVQ
jgi:hypothetical protein